MCIYARIYGYMRACPERPIQGKLGAPHFEGIPSRDKKSCSFSVFVCICLYDRKLLAECLLSAARIHTIAQSAYKNAYSY